MEVQRPAHLQVLDPPVEAGVLRVLSADDGAGGQGGGDATRRARPHPLDHTAEDLRRRTGFLQNAGGVEGTRGGELRDGRVVQEILVRWRMIRIREGLRSVPARPEWLLDRPEFLERERGFDSMGLVAVIGAAALLLAAGVVLAIVWRLEALVGVVVILVAAGIANWYFGAADRRCIEIMVRGECPACGYAVGSLGPWVRGAFVTVRLGPEACPECGCAWPLVPPRVSRR